MVLDKMNKETERILAKKNVVGVGTIGKRVTKGMVTDERALRVYVSKKEPMDTLKDSDLVASSVDGVPTDIIEVGEIVALNSNSRKDKIREVKGGYSEGNIKISAGTGGPLVKTTATPFTAKGLKDKFVIGRLEPSTLYRISNAHVFCEDVRKDVSKQERRIAQPGAFDDSDYLNNIVGQLESCVKIEPGHPVSVDIGLRSCYDEESAMIEGIGVSDGFINFKEEDDITKSGRTTQITEGIIVDEAVTLNVKYNEFIGTIKDVHLASNMSQGGDSGSSVIKTSTKKIGGIVFAGSSQYTCIIPIANILKIWNLELPIDEEEPGPEVSWLMKFLMWLYLLFKGPHYRYKDKYNG